MTEVFLSIAYLWAAVYALGFALCLVWGTGYAIRHWRDQ